MEGEKYERTMSCDTMGTRPTAKVFVREFSVYVKLRNDICYLFKCKEDAKGQDIMDEMCDKLGIVEKDYFGLQYSNRSNEAHWLNMRNKVFRQVNKNEPHLLFRVKFYVQPHQLLQESSRRQFFLNVKYEIMNGKYNASVSKMPRLYALFSQVEAGRFKENHISYNPSRTSKWDPEFRTKVILEHCKLQDMTPEVAEFFCLKEVAELEEYGMEYCTVRTDDNHNAVEFGIGIDSIRIDYGSDEIQNVPYTCLRKATHTGKTVKLNIIVSDNGDTDTVVYRLNTKESAVALYRSITEHHAFYRCDSVRPAVKQQVARDIFDTILSWFHEDSQNYIFDTERTCREAYDYARRTLYNFGTSAAADMTQRKVLSRETSQEEGDSSLEGQVMQLKEDLQCLTEAFYCSVCRDAIVDVVLQCGHLICSSCGQICEECPFCRVHISTKTKFYLPINLTQNLSPDQLIHSDSMVDCHCSGME